MVVSENAAWLDWAATERSRAREVWYGLVGHPTRPVAFWFRYSLLSTGAGDTTCRLWAALTDRDGDAVFETRTVDASTVESERDPFRIVAGKAGALEDDAAHGRTDTVRWSFEYDPDPVTFTPLRSRRLTNLASRVLGTGHHWSVNQSIRLDGTVTVGDRTVEFEDAPGHQGHTAGGSVPDGWQWVHCNDFDRSEVALEALGLGGKLSICLRRDGAAHRLNRLWHVLGPRGNRTVETAPGRWRFHGRGDGAEVRATVTADEECWQRAAYPCPDGSRRFVAHCSLSSVDLSYRVKNGGWSAWRRATSDGGRAEWAGREPPVPGTYRPA